MKVIKKTKKKQLAKKITNKKDFKIKSIKKKKPTEIADKKIESIKENKNKKTMKLAREKIHKNELKDITSSIENEKSGWWSE